MRPKSVSNLIRKGMCTFVIAVCVTLAGCQTMQTRSSMEAKHIDAADPCGPTRSRLIGTQDHFEANILGGALSAVLRLSSRAPSGTANRTKS